MATNLCVKLGGGSTKKLTVGNSFATVNYRCVSGDTTSKIKTFNVNVKNAFPEDYRKFTTANFSVWAGDGGGAMSTYWPYNSTASDGYDERGFKYDDETGILTYRTRFSYNGSYGGNNYASYNLYFFCHRFV